MAPSRDVVPFDGSPFGITIASSTTRKSRTIVTPRTSIIHVHTSDIPVEIETRGGVSDLELDDFQDRIARVVRPIADRLIDATALLAVHHDHDPGAQARAKVTLRSKGDTVRAEVYAPTVGEAAASVESRIRRQLEQRVRRAKNDPRGKEHGEGEWRHGNLRSPKGQGFDRPVEDRAIVVRKSPATPLATLEEAQWDRFVLDYDFFLFVDADTGRDVVLASGDDEGDVRLLDVADAPTTTVADARTWIDETGEDFHFFRDLDSMRGAVIYRRYDGHYGLLTPGDGSHSSDN